MDVFRRGSIFLSIIFMFTTYAHADEDHFCPSGDLGDGTAPTTRISTWRAGNVTAGSSPKLRLEFDGDSSVCGDTPCFARGGSTGVEVRRAGSSVCVGVPQKGKLATMFGWIPASRWHAGDGSPQPVARWIGVWQNATAKITVRRSGDDRLDIEGHAIRALDADGGHDIYGDFAISGKLENGTLTGGDGSCQVSVRLVGDYLAMADNDACGGMGVSFFGIYRLRHH